MSKDLGTVGLCLAGSGSRGIVGLGALKAIEDMGIKCNKVFTSSSGTLNGLLYASGDLNLLEHIWTTIKTSDVYHKNPCSYLKAFGSSSSIYNSKPLLKTLEKYCSIPKLRQFDGKLFINATELISFKPLTFELGELKDEEILPFAFASASPPVFFPPIKFRDYLLSDSGVSNNYSLVSAISENCDTLIIVAPSIMEPRKVNNLIDMVKCIMSISMQTYLSRELRAIEKINDIIDSANIILPDEQDLRKINIIYIAPEVNLDIDFLDFDFKGYDRKDLINYGYDLAMEKLMNVV